MSSPSGVAKHARVVGLEQVHGARAVMAAAAARDAVAAVGVGQAGDRRDGHSSQRPPSGQPRDASSGAIRASSLRTAAAVGRSAGLRRSVEKSSSGKPGTATDLASMRSGGGKPSCAT